MKLCASNLTMNPEGLYLCERLEGHPGQCTGSPNDSERAIDRQDFDAAALDPGVRSLVIALRNKGYETTDSGDGVTKPPDQRVLDVPHVFIRVRGSRDLIDDARTLHRWLARWGDRWIVEANYSTADGIALLIVRKEPTP